MPRERFWEEMGVAELFGKIDPVMNQSAERDLTHRNGAIAHQSWIGSNTSNDLT
jgi:hypothetical protein